MSRLRRQLLERSRRRDESHENRERWLLTYADMITLLLGLFIIMYSISQVDQNKLKQVADVIRGGFGLGESFFQGNNIAIEEDPLLQPRTQLYRFWERVSYALKRLKEKAKLNIGIQETEEIKIVLFGTSLGEGQFRPDEDMNFAFQKISEMSGAMDVDISLRVQIPYGNEAAQKGFRNAWEYNAYRAELIADSLSKNYNIPKERISIEASSSYKAPENSPLTPEGKASGERVEIFIRKKSQH
ncbi:endoflagellar motor protein [Leptospira gomenensis]|uniref:Endoflagellar motor protein n=1 Tax=Leptospira gomenensis TaxID=2484974 RepID=A0A5F1YDP6_9LEPT|nr:flagellar motor protein MotB [Leptospira gomenensis]TGK35909.1 endoflagellar motor protein [Leptospira gomenensis]TGK40059.1 endoflagellar motor protein [Leptospira gomenensis]TGK51509.1 endoflagellar motor protein [Leptospira gomenensis]TGK68066.1 endoflagellar motor protein [Leptospira gomenensis]